MDFSKSDNVIVTFIFLCIPYAISLWWASLHMKIYQEDYKKDITF